MFGDWVGRSVSAIVEGVKTSSIVKVLASKKSWTCEAMAERQRVSEWRMRTVVNASKISVQQKCERTSDVDGRILNRISEAYLNPVRRVIQEKLKQ